MSKIHVLDPMIANKIAAGEVVEKPASVIKELVENAIDADASSITIEIKAGGKEYIRVSDNGSGIESEDMLTAFQRHATSKIAEIDDIYNIQSLGFRGEALASIASVSSIELISKIADNEFGERLLLSGGKLLSRESVGASNGTTIIMKDLFFNTPARLKFLKSDGAEQNAISTIVNKLALSHTDISFNYIINDRIIFKTSGNDDLKDAVYEIYGKNVSKDMLPFEFQEAGIQARGLLSSIEFTRGNRQLQVVFVNGRYIVNKVVSEALELAYKGLVPLHRHPLCFIFLEIDPRNIDVNIHPSKTEIKFHNEGQIKQSLYSALRKEINRYNQVPQTNFKNVDVFSKTTEKVIQNEVAKTQILDEDKAHTSPLKTGVRESINTNKPVAQKDPVDLLYQSVHEKEAVDKVNNPDDYKSFPSPNKASTTKNVGSSSAFKKEENTGNQYDFKDLLVRETPEKSSDTKRYLPDGQSIYDDLNYIGQAFESYLMFQKGTQLYFIDQHAAHEKILYEAFKEKYKNRAIEAQLLLDPITIQMTYNEQELLLSKSEAFQKIGFDIEAFGMNDIIVRSVPILFDRPAGLKFIESLIEGIDGQKDLSTLQDEEIIMQSCKAAIKANHKVDMIEVKELLKDLRNLNDPYTCPHGRPIIIALHEYEIERKFKRS